MHALLRHVRLRQIERICMYDRTRRFAAYVHNFVAHNVNDQTFRSLALVPLPNTQQFNCTHSECDMCTRSRKSAERRKMVGKRK
jgi:hypothetical protein